MKRLLLMAGHGAGDPGAVANGRREADETRRVAASLSKALKDRCAVTVYPTDRNAYSDYLAGKLRQQVQFSQFDAVVEIHFNACTADRGDGQPKGVECWIPEEEPDTALAAALCRRASSLGFPNRGVKRKDWAVIHAARSRGVCAVLLEVCFLDDGDDMALYDRRYDALMEALADGVAETLGLRKEGQAVTYEEFVGHMARYEQEQAQLPPAAWSLMARDWAERTGVLKNGRYGSRVTREELAQALYNLTEGR